MKKDDVEDAMEVLGGKKVDDVTKERQLKVILNHVSSGGDLQVKARLQRIVEQLVQYSGAWESLDSKKKKPREVRLRELAVTCLRKLFENYFNDLDSFAKDRVTVCLMQLLEEAKNDHWKVENLTLLEEQKKFYQKAMLFLGDFYQQLRLEREADRSGVVTESLMETMEKNWSPKGSRAMRKESAYCLLKVLKWDHKSRKTWNRWLDLLGKEICEVESR